MNRVFLVSLCCLLVLVFSACAAKPTADARAVETQVAARIFATQTASVPTRTNTPQATTTPVPSATPTSCSKRVTQFLQQAQDTLKQFQDAEMLASKTPRVAMTQSIGKLQDTRRQFGKLPEDECTILLKGRWELYMDSVIDGYLAFMGQANDSAVSSRFDKARSVLGDISVITEIVSSSDQPVVPRTVRYKTKVTGLLDVEYLTLTESQREVGGNTWETTLLFVGDREPEVRVSDSRGYAGASCELWLDDQLIDSQTTTERGATAVCRGNPR